MKREAVRLQTVTAGHRPTVHGTEKLPDINIMLMDLRGVSENAGPVIDAMNAITEKSCGVRAKVTWASTGDYASKLNLSISGGEQLDLAMIVPVGVLISHRSLPISSLWISQTISTMKVPR